MKSLFFTLIFLIFVQPGFANVTQVADGVYAGQTTTLDGKTVYLGMEQVNSSNKSSWDNYKNNTSRIAQQLIHPLALLASQGGNLPGYEEAKALTGFSEEEYTEYIEAVTQRIKSKPEIAERIRLVTSGVVGMHLDSDGNTYVVYASKKPVTGKFKHPEEKKSMTLKEFIDGYGDLLITVRSDLKPGPPVYENRGIFRNPNSIVEGGYAQLSLILHGFTAAVAETYFKDKKYMMVTPTRAMQAILVKNLKKGQAFIGHNKKAPYPDFPPLLHRIKGPTKIAKEGVNTKEYESQELPEDKSAFTAKPGDGIDNIEGADGVGNLIKIEELAKFYRK